MKHIKKPFEKFKSELLAKGFYDIFKAILIFAGGLLSTYFVSLIPLVKISLVSEVKTPLYQIIILSVFIISLFFLIFRYKSKLDNLIRDNNIDELTGLKNHKGLKISLEPVLS